MRRVPIVRRRSIVRREVPLRRSLLVKLLVLSALVSACSIAATAWLTVHTTAVAISKQQGQTLSDGAQIYDTLLGYAASHHTWSGAGPTVRRLARQTHYRVTLTDPDRRPILDSAAASDPPPAAPPGSPSSASPSSVSPSSVSASSVSAVGAGSLPSQASAVIDPLAVNTALMASSNAATLPSTWSTSSNPAASPAAASAGTPAPCPPGVSRLRCEAAAQAARQPTTVRSGDQSAGQSTGQSFGSVVSDRIDPRAVGPFLLTAGERKTLHAAAAYTKSCLQGRFQIKARIVDTPSGRPSIETPQLKSFPTTSCDSPVLNSPTKTEATALRALNARVDRCLSKRRVPSVVLLLDLSWTQRAPHTVDGDQLVATCINSSRSDLLAGYVAPPALLFITTPTQSAATFFDLSAANRARIGEVTALVMLVTITVTAVAGTRMSRPLRALASAARRMSDGDLGARVEVASTDEIGSVATAFNVMAERRVQLEGARKDMVNDVAHELRTPLSNIRGWLEGVADGLVVPDQALSASLLDEAMLLQHVIDDLRDLSAADAGELKLHPELVDVQDLLRQVAIAHRGRADAAGVSLIIDGEGQPEMIADPVRLRQAVSNLVSNAVRHTPAGGSVQLRARTNGAEVVIDVADTGSGIGSEDLPRIFDRFWRAEKSRSRQTGGSGLGLAIVRNLVEAHGGTVSAASPGPGFGSVFTLRLPCDRTPSGP